MPEDIKKEAIDNETAENKAEEIEIEGADEESTQAAEEAKIQIIEPLMKMDQFYMKHRELRLKVCERNLKEISYDTLIENYYFEEQPRNITIKFCSPTAFKSQGNYIFMPTVRLIFQSLIHKYDTFFIRNNGWK